MACEFALLWAAQLAVEIDGPPSLFPPAEPAAASRICAASRHLHRHYRMRRKRRAARRRPPYGGPQFNVKTLAARKVAFPEVLSLQYRGSPDAELLFSSSTAERSTTIHTSGGSLAQTARPKAI